MSEANVFAEKHGYSIHFKVTVDDGDLNKLKNNTEVFLNWMKDNGYVHDSSKDRGRGGGRPPQAPPTVQQNGTTLEIKCGRCQGPVYDNRDRNKERVAKGERPMPAFKCKKQECGWILWAEQLDNYINERTEREPVPFDPDAVPNE